VESAPRKAQAIFYPYLWYNPRGSFLGFKATKSKNELYSLNFFEKLKRLFKR
jgi:hypothetical protein